ncbi:adenylate/guanylate cyclase domain-containing protein [Oscillatoria sp. FACHB-1406]|uniref:adenylate/guanylate cyclase domain-containing protein n=1 Tax=Oscillatoria sp. FACHB-1406 TaxID=2692846 RepID=UPI00168813B6|nr:adenylate/guanylate cyclase domain-containing protein [Oscillatoria sp. FACHB-1406]MBD2576754.1 response regulator [Oscillatoria sp. FACHB-1406]
MKQDRVDEPRVDIIAVDDNPVNLRVLDGMLVQRGYKVRSVTNGAIAIQAAKAKPPDLILLDIMMPELDGYEVCKQLQADERTREIPVIFISALNDAVDKVKAFQVGGADYISKPFQMEEVIARIDNQLKLRSLSKQLSEQNAQLQQEIQERQRAEEETQLLLTVTQEISSTPDFESALAVALERVCQVSGWSYGEAWIPSLDGTALECSPAWYCNATELEGEMQQALARFRYRRQKQVRKPHEGIIGRVWAGGEPEYVENIAREGKNHYLRAREAQLCGIKSALAVPIVVPPIVTQKYYEPGRVLAVLVFFLLESSARFSIQENERLAELISSVATQLGKVMQQKQTEAELRGLFSAMDDSIRVYDKNGRCLKTVTSGRNAAKSNNPEALASSELEHLSPETAAMELEAIARSLATQTTQTIEYSILVNNRPTWFSAKISPLSDKTAIFVARDITARKQAEDEVRLLLDIGRAISAAPDFDSALAVTLSQVCQTTGWVYGEAWVPAADGTAIECSSSWYRPPVGIDPTLASNLDRFRNYSEVLTFVRHQGLPGQIWIAGTPQWMTDFSTADDAFLRLELARECGLQSAFGVPISVSSDWQLESKSSQDENLAANAQKEALFASLSSRGSSALVLAVLIFFTVESRPQDERMSQLVAAIAAQLGTVLQQKKAEAELRALFAAMTDVVLVRDASGCCLKVAPTNSPNWYKKPEALLGRMLHEDLPLEQADLILSSIKSSLSTRKTLNIEYSLPIGGQEVWLAETISPMTDDTAILVARDITNRKQTEEALRLGEERLQLALEGSALGIWDWHVANNQIYLSPEWKAILGYEVDEIDDSISFWEQLVHPDDFPAVWEALGSHLDAEIPIFQEEFRMKAKSGEWRWILSHGKVFERDRAGKPLRMTGTHKDVTERKQVEQAIQERAQSDRLLGQISRTFIDRDVNAAIQFALAALGGHTDADRSYVMRYSDDRTVLTNTHEWCRAGVRSLKAELQNVPLAPCQGLYAPLLNGEVVQIPSIADLPPEAAAECQILHRNAVQSLINVPMVYLGKVVGCIGLESARSHRVWTKEEIRLLTLVSETIAIGFAQAEAESKRQQAEAAMRLAKQQSERLLLNILPRSIADQLKQATGAIAQQFDDVAILFADIVGFTPLSAQMSPIQLVNLLNGVFSAFDKLADRYGLEKIKTIGDAYMVVSGLPRPQEKAAEANPRRIAEMALAMQEVMQDFHTESGELLQLRIGINLGSVVAGVIGIKKFSYDLWGDAVNVASRMESQGKPGRIQVTAELYERLKDRFIFIKRGEIEVKGRGEMTTYWLTGKREPPDPSQR